MRTCPQRPDTETLNHKPIQVQDGWRPNGTRRMRQHQPQWALIACGYSDRATDPECGECKRRNQ